jgi:glycosyltransferase involved in cell wall biosynthesis
MKLALAHDWVVNIGGAERCLEAFHEIWPEAPLYTLVYKEESANNLGFDPLEVHSSFLQHFPFAQSWYRKYLPFYPLAVEQFDLAAYDVIISSSHAAAKGVLANSNQVHICYCHTPMRYAWDLSHRYLKENRLEKGLKSFLARLILHYIRIWDLSTANRVDHFIANSHFTARRIWRAYRREATIIYPPVNTERFTLKKEKDKYFLFVSRLVPYKKADLVISAFNKLGLPLLVVGDGPHFKECRRIARKNVEFLGYQEDTIVAGLVAGARALLFAAEEDFGIVPVEAQACGTPVIAYGRGGALETVVPAEGENWSDATGLFFLDQSVESIEKAVRRFLKIEGSFKPEVIRRNAEYFSRERFKEHISTFAKERVQHFWEKGVGKRKIV